MIAAPDIFDEDRDWPLVATIQIAGLPHFCSLAGASGTSTAILDHRRVAILAMTLPGSPRGLYQPLTRASGEAMIAGIRRALDEAGL